MPRPKPPPTPSSSTDLAAVERSADMEGSFALPPPAVHHKPSPKQTTPPTSPKDKTLAASPRHKRTLSGATKKEETAQYNLPPPPSRARKIIQMKPKSTSGASSSPSETSQAAPAKNNPAKRKQPSATSAAGRKIARKTAHSIIERRRRSKMNEEFGVLKDMIPACEGVEMHKLAILQAGIEYVRYLEGCIAQLKDDRRAEPPQWRMGANDEEDEDEESEEECETAPKRTATNSTTDWQARKHSLASSSNASPDIPAKPHRPILPGIPGFANSPTPFSAHSASATPTPTLLSPAFNAIHFSPDLARMGTNSTTATSLSIGASPNILPLPQALMPLNRELNKSPAALSEGGAEATATAALMMLTNDRRATGESGRGKGMSVQDLLSS